MDFNSIAQYLTSHLQSIIGHTFSSPSKYIRLASYTSSLLISWSTLRWAYINIKCKICNYPPCVFAGVPLVGGVIYALFSNDMAMPAIYMGTSAPINMFILGSAKIVYLNDMKLINNEVYSKNVNRHYASLYADGIDQFVMIGGEIWKKRRQIALNAFKFNSSEVNQGYLNILTTYMFPKIDQYDNKPYVTLRDDLRYLVFSLIYSTSFGHSAKLPAQTDEIMQQFFRASEVSNAYFTEIFFSGFIYGVKMANFLNSTIFNKLEPYKASCDIVTKWIEDYEEVVGPHQRDGHKNYYVDEMLDHVANNKLSRTEMLRDACSMFSGGLDTTVLTLELGFLYLVKYQDVQQRVYEELWQYEEKSGAFSLKHVKHLHVLRAFVLELLRNIKHLLAAIPRYVCKDTQIGGYTVPKGWFVSANHYYINHCSKYWEKPNGFYIDHFLDENNCFKRNECMMSFGVGKRSCMGKELAKKNLHVLFAKFILRYKLLPKENDFKSFRIPKVWQNVIVPTTPIVMQIRQKR